MNPRIKSLTNRVGIILLVAAAPVGVYLAPSAEHGPSYPKTWDARVLPIVTFVERERGLTFAHPVNVAFLDEEQFAAKVTSEEEPTKAEEADEERFVKTLRALGLIAGKVDLRAATDDLREAGVVGLYVSETKTLYIRGTELTPFVRSTVAHELTHALQDQEFDLDKLVDSAPYGDDTALRGLIEGDAVRVEEAYQRSLAPEDLQAFETESNAASTRTENVDVPAILRQLQELPYVLGPGLVDHLLQLGGNKGVDQAFKNPPVSELQLADPTKFDTSWRPTKVADPKVPAKAKDVQPAASFGQISLLQVLGTRLGYSQARAAVQGWTGDSYRTYELDGAGCVQVDVLMSDVTAAKRLGIAMTTWTAARSKAETSLDDRTVTLRACDPGTASTIPVVQPDAFEVLAGKAQLQHYLVAAQRVPPVTAECLATDVLRRLGDQLFAAASAGESSPDQQGQVAGAFQQAVTTCGAGG